GRGSTRVGPTSSAELGYVGLPLRSLYAKPGYSLGTQGGRRSSYSGTELRTTSTWTTSLLVRESQVRERSLTSLLRSARITNTPRDAVLLCELLRPSPPLVT